MIKQIYRKDGDVTWISYDMDELSAEELALANYFWTKGWNDLMKHVGEYKIPLKEVCEVFHNKTFKMHELEYNRRIKTPKPESSPEENMHLK